MIRLQGQSLGLSPRLGLGTGVVPGTFLLKD